MLRKLSSSVPLFIFFGLLFLVWAFVWEHQFYLYFAGFVCFFRPSKIIRINPESRQTKMSKKSVHSDLLLIFTF